MSEQKHNEIDTLLEKAHDLHRIARTYHIRHDPKQNMAAVDMLLRVVIALLNDTHSYDEYISNKLGYAVEFCGYRLEKISEKQCGHGITCPFHEHSEEKRRYEDRFRALKRRAQW